jgi:hypothetical protein
MKNSAADNMDKPLATWAVLSQLVSRYLTFDSKKTRSSWKATHDRKISEKLGLKMINFKTNEKASNQH